MSFTGNFQGSIVNKNSVSPFSNSFSYLTLRVLAISPGFCQGVVFVRDSQQHFEGQRELNPASGKTLNHVCFNVVT